MNIYSFKIDAEFAVFRDPSVTTSKTTYIVPNKSMIIGLLGSMIGIPRSKSGNVPYSPNYLDFFSKTRVGIRVEALNKQFPSKMVLYTNHRSCKESQTKPFKGELLISPEYRFYFTTSKEYASQFESTMPHNRFVYTPYLGHAYCLARISEFQIEETKPTEDTEIIASTVFLKEEKDTTTKITPIGGSGGSIFIERHLHHFVRGDDLTRKVVRYYIPINMDIEIQTTPQSINEFLSTDKGTICFF